MQTSLTPELANTARGKEAQAILRKCVHCGFCNATCPTYRLLGHEADGPRGRIYLIKQVLEGGGSAAETRYHLDRCLTCRHCETTCPSGVEYGKLAEIGRDIVAQPEQRTLIERWRRALLTALVRKPRVFAALLVLGQGVKGLLPRTLADKVYRCPAVTNLRWPPPRHGRKMVVLAGCAQQAMTPDVNRAAANVLDRLGISLIEVAGAGCCGSLDLHTTSEDKGRAVAKKLIDKWLPLLEQGVEAFISPSSGCGAALKDYGHLFRADAVYRDKAQRIAAHTKDLSEIVESAAGLTQLRPGQGRTVAFHAPCTLRHGQKITGRVENILTRAGYRLVAVPEAGICCGSAGSYALLQPEIAVQLRDNKQKNLLAARPELICTANVGCQAHLAAGLGQPLRHWIELLL